MKWKEYLTEHKFGVKKRYSIYNHASYSSKEGFDRLFYKLLDLFI